MIKYMEEKFGDRATKGDKSGLEFLRNEVKRLEVLVAEQKEKTAGTTDDDKKSDKGSENETDSDVSTLPNIQLITYSKNRTRKIMSIYFPKNLPPKRDQDNLFQLRHLVSLIRKLISKQE